MDDISCHDMAQLIFAISYYPTINITHKDVYPLPRHSSWIPVIFHNLPDKLWVLLRSYLVYAYIDDDIVILVGRTFSEHLRYHWTKNEISYTCSAFQNVIFPDNYFLQRIGLNVMQMKEMCRDLASLILQISCMFEI